MARGTNTKLQILNRAEDLFRQRSYTGFSYQDIAKPLGIKNAAIHYHFPTKGDLGIAIIERYRKLLARQMRNLPTTGDEARNQLRLLFAFEIREHSGRQRMCPLTILATDYEAVTPDMREHGRLLIEEMQVWLTQVLSIGRRHGAFHFSGDPADKAVLIWAAFMGARQLSRVAGSAALEKAIGQIKHDLAIDS